jgi:hypothetical protein
VTGRRRLAAAAAVLGCTLASPLSAQTAATLGMSASVVEYEGFLASGAVTLTPTLRYDAADLSLGIQGNWTVFESGNRVIQATAAGAWLSRPRGPWRAEISSAAGASRYADEAGSGHAQARVRVHRASASAGGWGGIAAGFVSAGSRELPVQLELGGWAVRDRFIFVGTATQSWLGDERHLDLFGAARWASGDRVELEARVGVRPWAHSGQVVGDAVAGIFGEVSGVMTLSPRFAVSVGAGSYPADPVRRILAARYVSAGLRIAVLRPAASGAPLLDDPALAAARARITSSPGLAGDAPLLQIVDEGPLVRLEVHAPGARSVELMADFTDWQPISLTRADGDRWEVQLPLAPGVHRLNLRIDGGAWVVPAGARAEPGEFGGAVGVIVVRHPSMRPAMRRLVPCERPESSDLHQGARAECRGRRRKSGGAADVQVQI